jgi:hypothetical protein
VTENMDEGCRLFVSTALMASDDGVVVGVSQYHLARSQEDALSLALAGTWKNRKPGFSLRECAVSEMPDEVIRRAFEALSKADPAAPPPNLGVFHHPGFDNWPHLLRSWAESDSLKGLPLGKALQSDLRRLSTWIEAAMKAPGQGSGS